MDFGDLATGTLANLISDHWREILSLVPGVWAAWRTIVSRPSRRLFLSAKAIAEPCRRPIGRFVAELSENCRTTPRWHWVGVLLMGWWLTGLGAVQMIGYEPPVSLMLAGGIPALYIGLDWVGRRLRNDW